MSCAPYLDSNILPDLYDDPALSDVTICFSDRKVRAHKLVLAMASPYFKKAFLGEFMESSSQELWLYEDDPDAVEAMLKSFYGLDTPELGLYFHFRLFAAASKYDAYRLLRKTLTVLEIGLEEKKDTKLFPQLVHEVYENVPTHCGELKSIVKFIVRQNLKNMVTNKAMKQVLSEIPELAIDVLEEVADEDKPKHPLSRSHSYHDNWGLGNY